MIILIVKIKNLNYLNLKLLIRLKGNVTMNWSYHKDKPTITVHNRSSPAPGELVTSFRAI